MPRMKSAETLRAELATPRAAHLPGRWPITSSEQLLGRGGVMVDWHPATVIGQNETADDAGWIVRHIGFVVDPRADLPEKPGRLFYTHSQHDLTTRGKAIAWASARYGKSDWARTPFGAWAPREQILQRYDQMGIDPRK